MTHNAKYTTHLDVYARLTTIIKNKIINPADVLEWSLQCEIEFIEDFLALVPYRVNIPVKDFMARVPPYCQRILEVYDSNDKKINYYNNGAYLVLNSDYNEKSVNLSFMGLMIDQDTGIPLIKKGHEEACMRHCIVNLYYEDYINGKITKQAYDDMKEERTIQVRAAQASFSGFDRKDLDELNAIILNMMPTIRYSTLSHKETGR